jgi:hypothetical protein
MPVAGNTLVPGTYYCMRVGCLPACNMPTTSPNIQHTSTRPDTLGLWETRGQRPPYLRQIVPARSVPYHATLSLSTCAITQL